MRTAFFSSLVFALLTHASTSLAAPPLVTPPVPAPVVVKQAVSSERVGKVNINAADAETLKRDLSGIGSAKANAIVAYRESNGPFASVDELLEVKGIGKALLDKNRDKLAIQ